MARFELGDRVRREIFHGPNYVRIGTITAVIPNFHSSAIFAEYEVDFGANGILIAYDSQLEPA
jgi:hypothetical protein